MDTIVIAVIAGVVLAIVGFVLMRGKGSPKPALDDAMSDAELAPSKPAPSTTKNHVRT